MEFQQFVKYIMTNIGRYLPEDLKDASIAPMQATKVNDTFLTGLLVSTIGEDFSPVIYLNSYYDNYLNNVSLDVICREISDEIVKYRNKPVPNIDRKTFENIENVKDKIALFVVNVDFCKKFLEEVPYIVKEDLALFYKVVVLAENGEMASITINKRYMENWGIDVNVLHEYAMQNSNSLLPVKVQTMGEVLRDMYPSGELEFPLDTKNAPMYVITNQTNMNGASAIFYSDVLERISEKEGTDLFILPSSIHEVIVIPKGEQDFRELEEMVKEINATVVPLEEWLSNHIYEYDARDKEIRLLSNASLSEKEQVPGIIGHRTR